MVRPATVEDTAAVVDLVVATGMFSADDAWFVEGMLADYFEADGADGHVCVVDEEGGDTVGVAYYQPKTAADRVWDLTMIAVRPDRQGRGRGAAMLRGVEEDLRVRGGRLLLVETSGTARYDRTRAFYAGCGYREEARVRDYWEPGDDLVLFRKSLDAEIGEGDGRMPSGDVEIRRIEDAGELDLLGPLWIALHRRHRGMLPPGTVVEDDLSWLRRRERYGGWMAAGRAIVLLARLDGVPAGYALAHLHDGPDETFAVGQRYAELASLSVAPGHRGRGIGTRLLDELDRLLVEDGIPDLVVSVMSDNADALRFYRRRGLRATETYLWRVAEAGRRR